MLSTRTGQDPTIAAGTHAAFTRSAVRCSTNDSGVLEAVGDSRLTPALEGHPSKVRVLVADDEQVIANTLTVILNQSGFEARAVYSGTAAVEAIAGFEPNVLVSDVMMPGMTGIEAAIAIRPLRPSCKVLLFSGRAATADMLQGARARGYGFDIPAKPVHPADLLARLQADCKPVEIAPWKAVYA